MEKNTKQDTLLEGVGDTTKEESKPKKGKDVAVGHIENETLPANMEMSTGDLAPAPVSGMSPEIANERAAWSLLKSQATIMMESGAVPKSFENVPCIMMALQAGREMGLKPIESLNSFYFVHGKIALYGQAAIRLVRRAGHYVNWGTCDDNSASVTITRCDDGTESTTTFTMKQADERKLHHDKHGKKKDIWVKYPENMLRFKAFHLCARFHVPDALAGIAIKEELEGRGYVEGLNNTQEIESESAPVEEAAEKLATPGAVVGFYKMADGAGWPEKEIERAILKVTNKDKLDDPIQITETQLRTLIDMIEGA